MDKLKKYRQAIEQILTEHAPMTNDDTVKAEFIFDRERDRYQLA